MSILTFCCWLALVWGAGWFFFPLAHRIFGASLPDGGLAVGRVLFLALWTLGAFWAGHAGIAVRTSAFFWVFLAALGLFLRLRDKKALPPETIVRKRAMRTSDAIFLLTFLGFFALRGYWSDTDGNNGEKSMDSALIGSLTRAQKLPPPNPYAAGANLRGYYYFGHLEAALLTDASGTTTRWSYNLMCATLPALCFSTLFSLGAGLTGRLRGGAVVSFSVLGLGTLEPIVQWCNPTKFGPSTPLKLDHFATSRIIPYSINEFPWFTFNQADLHAHYFDFPFALATMCLAYALFRGHKKALLPAILVLGVQVMTNTWDFPAYGILLALSVFCATLYSPLQGNSTVAVSTGETLHEGDAVAALPETPLETEPPLEKPKPAFRYRLGTVLLLFFGSLLVAAPYLLNLKTAANPPRALPQPASPLREWLILWGPYAGAWLSFLCYTLFKTRFERVVCLGFSLAVLFVALHTQWFVPSPAPYLGSRLVLPLILLLLLLSTRGAWKLRETPRYLCFLAIGGLLALLWSETTWAGFLGDINNPGFDDYKRQDTVFKFGLQTWMLWGVAVSSGVFITVKKWPEALKCAFIVMLPIMVIASTAVTFGRARNFSSWDGWDGWAHLAPTEKDAATWLVQNTPPGDNILEAEDKPGGDYSSYTRYTHATGIPTIIGPQAHSFQWSPANAGDTGKEWEEVFRRKADARAFYTVADLQTQREILEHYHVRYIVFGALEHDQYGEDAFNNIRANWRQVAAFGPPDDPHAVWIFAGPGA